MSFMSRNTDRNTLFIGLLFMQFVKYVFFQKSFQRISLKSFQKTSLKSPLTKCLKTLFKKPSKKLFKRLPKELFKTNQPMIDMLRPHHRFNQPQETFKEPPKKSCKWPPKKALQQIALKSHSKNLLIYFPINPSKWLVIFCAILYNTRAKSQVTPNKK